MFKVMSTNLNQHGYRSCTSPGRVIDPPYAAAVISEHHTLVMPPNLFDNGLRDIVEHNQTVFPILHEFTWNNEYRDGRFRNRHLAASPSALLHINSTDMKT